MSTDVITLSLVSHTNVGKTTLARTLLRRDIGEVGDQAHVTDASEAHALIQDGGRVLRLWDTPGFGDSARLLRRLRSETKPLGWLLHQVWDRFVNRPLFCTQEAVRNVRDEADVVLYLVNASEDPEEAGYVTPELQLLEWTGRPVVVVLNQARAADGAATDTDAVVARWRAVAERWKLVRGVLVLDAFSRCWVQEGELLSRVAAALPPDRRPAMEALAQAWTRRNVELYARCVGAMSRYLARAVSDSEPLDPELEPKRAARPALDRLATRLAANTRALTDSLVAEHGLDGRSADELRVTIADVVGPPAHAKAKPGLWALAGAAATGALGGLAADVVAGGLTFGGGAVIGAIAGLVGGASAAKGFELVRNKGEGAVRWSPAFVDQLCRQTLLRYLAVAHFGRGRGDFRDVEQPRWWRAEIDRAVEARRERLQEALEASAADGAASRVEAVLVDVLRDVLVARYPEARAIVR